ncbi:cytochrome P450 [Mycobacterium colombiense]|uniref:Cytochrome P450 271A1 Cyp271A1 n=1 Tax=Mycobacterium colombiense CECT 3035 TaxID=1041522 RepID=J4TIU6_9MYCO|nr:cytochrome P450 [Mycobacterium colombiense]EJO89493.1 cytochrome P450 271A1 Cyp271A1 [Mycobacterium colombiense CECT 3035]
MTQATRFDPRVQGLGVQLKSVAEPQGVYHDKAKNIRAEYIDGALHLYRHDDILTINRHPAVLGNGGRGGTFGHGAKLIPLEIDGEDHRKWRRLLDPMFAPKRVALLEAQVRELARELIDRFVSNGKAELSEDFCVPLPCLTFLRLVGAPVSDLDFFLEFKKGVLHPEGDTVEEIEANMAVAGGKLVEYFVGFLSDKRKTAHEQDDVIAKLITAEVDGEPISDADLINILFLLMFAGLDTVTCSMACIFTWLGRHPEERKRLVEDPSLIPAAVEELLRYESPVPSGIRYPQEDIDLGDGLVVRAGDEISAFWATANVDPTHFDNSLAVKLDRGRKDHMVFASGTHRCLGSHLARLELRLAVEELLQRIPEYSIDVDGLVFDNRAVRTIENIQISFPVSG